MARWKNVWKTKKRRGNKKKNKQKVMNAIDFTESSIIHKKVKNIRPGACKLPLPEMPQTVGYACGNDLDDDKTKHDRKLFNVTWEVTDVLDIAAGKDHCMVLTECGIVLTFGCNAQGALGRDATEEESKFTPLPPQLPGRALKISAGQYHSACLLEDGRIFAWGSFCDFQGRMGTALDGSTNLPVEIMRGVRCCDIASGANHLVILTCDGEVYTLGCGEQGQLGRVSLCTASGDCRRSKPIMLKPGLVFVKRRLRIESIWATDYGTFLKEFQTGIIWGFGLNNYNQLAIKEKLNRVIKPIKLEIENVKQIAGGQHHTLFLKTDGSVYSVGRGHNGRLGLGDLNEDVTTVTRISAFQDKFVESVFCGEATSFALTEGQLYGWGKGLNHQSDIATAGDVTEPKLIFSKYFESKSIIKVSSCGQRFIILVENKLRSVNTVAYIEITNNERSRVLIVDINTEEDDATISTSDNQDELAQSSQSQQNIPETSSTQSVAETTTVREGTEAAGEETTPAGEVTEAAGEDATPAGERTEAAGEETTPAGEGTEAAGEETTTAAEVTEAAGEGTEAAGEVTEAAGEGTTTAAEVTEAAVERTEAAGEGTETAIVQPPPPKRARKNRRLNKKKIK